MPITKATNQVTTLSATDVGLGNVTNESKATMFTNPTFTGTTSITGLKETVFSVSGTTPALSPANGTIQTWTLSASSTPTAGTWNAGESLTIFVDDGTAYTITWTSIGVTWLGGTAPSLHTTAWTIIELFKVGTTIYGSLVGYTAA